MKIKELLVMLLIVGLIGSAVYSFVGDYDTIRWAGTNTLPGGTYHQSCDSTDTFQVDTFFSDTIDVGDYKWLNLGFALTGFTAADSANDSVWIKVLAWGTYDGAFKREVYRDSFNSTLDSTEELLGYVNLDSMGINQLYIQTVVSDSFILGEGIDTNTFRLNYEATQTTAK